ncbi:MAG: THUMP domain-containing class I SAM-dependent RNA methyltransferase [Candidatus Muiribacteriota bacterium]
MEQLILTATCAFGIETVLKREILNLGYENIQVFDGGVDVKASLKDIPVLNINLRTAERIFVKIGEFEAKTFEELFQNTKALPWDRWLPSTAEFPVSGKSIKSTLASVRSCQSIVKKAIVEKLKESYQTDWFEEVGDLYPIQISLYKDKASLTIDTSGKGLHKRGYRLDNSDAPLRETLAAAIVQLSFWNKNRRLIDPFCGSGTIPIEAAMLGRNIAPGINRKFCSQNWNIIAQKYWKEAFNNAKNAIIKDFSLNINGFDIDKSFIKAAKKNAHRAGVIEDINFENKPIEEIWIDKQWGVVITNPPYGKRMGEFKEINQIYINFNKIFKKKKGWSVYVLTSDEIFPKYFKRSWPDKKRKLYNGKILVYLYQYFGEKPPASA